MKNSVLILVLVMVILYSCKKEENGDPAEIWKDSVFIVNEGPFQNGTGSVMAYDRITGEVSGDLFEFANGRPLGNVVQSVSVNEDLVWIAVNNSNKIEIAALEDFKSVATLEDVSLPRYIVFADERAFISCWDNTVKIFSVSTFSKVEEFQAGTGPDEMAISGEFLFVINTGGFGVDSTVTFINVNDKEIIGKIEVGHRPSGIVKDDQGKLWVLCSGKGWNGFPASGDTPGKLVCIDPESKEVVREVEFPDPAQHPDQLIISGNGRTMYYSYPDGIYSFSPENASLPSAPLIPATIMYYGIGYDTAKDMIFASDPLDYAQNGRIHRFNALDGSALDSFEAGIIPGGFWFNHTR